MDKDNIFRALMAAAVAFLLWSLLSRSLFPPPPGTQEESMARTPRRSERAPAIIPAGMEIRGAESERFIELGNVNDDSSSAYGLHLTFSNKGASLASALLTDHAAEVGTQKRYELLHPVEVEGAPALYSFTTDNLNLNEGDDYPLAEVYWQSKTEESRRGQSVQFWVDFAKQGDEQPFARLTKTFALSPREQHNGKNDVQLSITFENFGAQALKAKIVQYGPVGLRQEDPRTDYRKIVAGIRDPAGLTLAPEPNTGLKFDGQPTNLLDAEVDPRPLEWIASGNKFFGVIVAPLRAEGQADWVQITNAKRLAGVEDEKDDASFELISSTFDVRQGGHFAISFDCYFGPKSKQLFHRETSYNERQYVELVNADYYMCAWAPIVNALLWLLNVCYGIIPNYGVAIIAMVLVVRAMLHPLTKKGQVNMTRMAGQTALLQPKMEELRKKYANDKTRQNQELMKLYQQEGVNPAGQILSCLPMMLQMPIWAGLWAALNFTVEMRHEPFILWIKDLVAPDALFTWDESLPLIGNTFNLLPLLLGLSMWLQQRFMPKPAVAVKQDGKKTDQMAQQRMMMYFMSALMIVFFYNAPSGLTLYIMASNFFGLIEQSSIRKHIKKQEEAEKARGPKKPADKKSFKKPKFLQKLEKLAEEAKKK